MVGSFCFTFLTDDGSVYGARDTKGFRPLIFGHHEKTNTYIIASESCALSAVGAGIKRDVAPGELVKMNRNGIEMNNSQPKTLILIVPLNIPTLHIQVALWKV